VLWIDSWTLVPQSLPQDDVHPLSVNLLQVKGRLSDIVMVVMMPAANNTYPLNKKFPNVSNEKAMFVFKCINALKPEVGKRHGQFIVHTSMCTTRSNMVLASLFLLIISSSPRTLGPRLMDLP
jgi:hypothetical protein